MSDADPVYPEALVARVAFAIVESTTPWKNAVVEATAVLDSLGLREEWGVRFTEGRYGFIVCRDEKWARQLSDEEGVPVGRRLVTDWEVSE